MNTPEAWEDGNQFALTILCSITYLTLRVTIGIPLTGQEDKVPPDKTDAKTSFDKIVREQSGATLLPKKPLMTTGEILNFKPLT